MPNKLITIMFLMTTALQSSFCAADNTTRCYSDLSQVMRCFMQHKDNIYSHQYVKEERLGSVSIKTHLLNAHIWPINNNTDIEKTVWKHRISIYIPDKILHSTALLYIAGGYNRDISGQNSFSRPKEILDFKSIAVNNNAVVISLEDIPNQFLFIDGKAKKEDQILAYTYKKVMENPMENAYLSGHLPMVKSVIKGMDASQEILADNSIEITDFVLVGASKRGWAVWLAALEDDRVSAIIPVVTDILDVPTNINHICNSYKDSCPPAMRDYKNEGIIENITSAAFYDLMMIEDPLSYLNNSNYASRFAIPKYIINAAGDDFYAPDSSKFYFNKLPGVNYIHYFPTAMHYIAGNPISDFLNNGERLNQVINSYLYFHLNDMTLPKISWKHSNDKISVSSSVKPKIANLWVAHNEEDRDFRFLNSYSKLHLGIKSALIFLAKYLPISPTLCDTCYIKQEINISCSDKEEICHIDAYIPEPKKGWQASFVELHYDIADKEFIATTEVYITPDQYPN